MKFLYLSLFLSFVVSLPSPHQSQQPGNAQEPKVTGRQRKSTTGAKIQPILRGNGDLSRNQQLAGNNVQVFEDIVAPTPGNPTKLQFKVAMPLNATGRQGLNVLLHGDGAASYFAFPNAKLQDDLIGVVVLAPNREMRWGGSDARRSDGPEHVRLVMDLIQNELPKRFAFDQSKLFFTGVSGGSLTLSSAMLPIFGDRIPGMMLLCGGLPPPNNIPTGKLTSNTRIHFQTSVNELQQLKTAIPAAIQFVSLAAQDLNVSNQQLNQQFTVDGNPNGSHCAFDGKGFNSGIQAIVSSFGDVMFRNQPVPGVTANQLQGILQNPNPFQ
jgi:hypothetical protein